LDIRPESWRYFLTTTEETGTFRKKEKSHGIFIFYILWEEIGYGWDKRFIVSMI
jgi:hypothetical protein